MRARRSEVRPAGQLALGVIALLASVQVAAATSTASLAVSATVEQACNLDVQPVRFETLRSDAPRADAYSSLAVACTPETSFTVTMDDGQHGAAGGRRLAGPAGGFLAYELYSDAARTRRWGASMAEAVSGEIVAGGAMTLPIYGRIDAPRAAAGAYSDVVTVTVNF